MKKDLLEGVQKVIVVATDEKAYQKVKQVPNSAGLLIPGKIEIILRNSFNDIFILTRHVPNLQIERFSAEIILLLKDIDQFPDDGVIARYQRLGFDTKKGNRLKKILIENSLVESEEVQASNTSMLLLGLTNTAEKLLSQYKKEIRVTRNEITENISHRKRPNRREWIATGIPQPDICIVIETGKSDVVSNVKRDLAEGYKKIIVVVADLKAFEKVVKRLNETELLISSRVDVVLKNEFAGY